MNEGRKPRLRLGHETARRLGMVYARGVQIGEQEGFGRWPLAPVFWLYGDEDCVDFAQHLGIVELEHPAPVGLVVYIKNTEADRRGLRCPAASPGLERLGLAEAGLALEIKGIEDQRLPFRVENAAKRLLGLALGINVKNVSDIELARSMSSRMSRSETRYWYWRCEDCS